MPFVLTSTQIALRNRPPRWPFAVDWNNPITDCLFGAWPVTNMSKTRILDLAGRGIHLEHLSGTPGNVPSPMGGFAFSNDGVSLHAARGVSPVPYASGYPITLSAYQLYRSSGSGDDHVIELNKTSLGRTFLMLRISGSSNNHDLRAGVRSGGSAINASTTDTGQTDEVYHHAGTFTASTLRVFRNGLMATGSASNTISFPMGSLAKTVQFGARQTGTQAMLDGLVFHGLAWSRELSDAEIHSLYEPDSRWAMYTEIGRRVYFFSVMAAPGGGLSAGSLALTGVGV